MVEPYDNVAAIATQGHHSTGIVGEAILGLLPHGLLGIALGVAGQLVDKLPGCGTVFIHAGNIGL